MQSPESMKRPCILTRAVDVYGFAITFWICWTSEMPYFWESLEMSELDVRCLTYAHILARAHTHTRKPTYTHTHTHMHKHTHMHILFSCCEYKLSHPVSETWKHSWKFHVKFLNACTNSFKIIFEIRFDPWIIFAYMLLHQVCCLFLFKNKVVFAICRLESDTLDIFLSLYLCVFVTYLHKCVCACLWKGEEKRCVRKREEKFESVCVRICVRENESGVRVRVCVYLCL